MPLFGPLKLILQFSLLNRSDIYLDLQEPAVSSCSSKIFKEDRVAFHEIKAMFLSLVNYKRMQFTFFDNILNIVNEGLLL